MSTKRKLPQKLALPKINQSAKIPDKGHFNESKAIVSGGGNSMKARTNGTHEVLEISSDESEEEEDSAEESSDESVHEQQIVEATNGEDVAMEDAITSTTSDNEENGEPTFGDLVRANAEQIDVAGAFEESNAVTYNRGAQIQPPSGASLGNVLAQALRTNDVSLLESCLHTTDVNIVRATIQRLESPLAATLLQKVAERLHRKPGRSGTLMVWVQWTLVTHGGYLATQQDLVKKLSDLNRVIDERAKGLQPLLSLKGKLDMLEAQIELRKSIQRQRLGIDEDEEDEGIIYVEGQESEEEEEGNSNSQRHAQSRGLEDIPDSGSEISDDMPTTNGIMIDSEEEESSDDEDLLDDEAEETDADTGDEEEIDHEDDDSEAEESDDAEVAPPSKLRRMSGVISKKR